MLGQEAGTEDQEAEVEAEGKTQSFLGGQGSHKVKEVYLVEKGIYKKKII